MPTQPDLESAPIKLQLAKSVLAPLPLVDIASSTKDFCNNAARIAAGSKVPDASAATNDSGYCQVQWSTVCATSCISSTFGTTVTSFHVESIGDGSKPVMIGFVPRGFTAFTSKLSEGGGWAVSSSGKVYGSSIAGSKTHKIPCSCTFTSGDRVTIKLEAHRGSFTVTVEPKSKKAPKTETTFVINNLAKLTASSGGFLVPAVSLACPGASIAVETVTDMTPIDAFSHKISGNSPSIGGATLPIDASVDDGSDVHDAFGPFWMRLYCRMADRDTVKASSSVVLTKADVKHRMLLSGSHANVACSAVIPGVLIPDPAAKRQQAIINKATAELFVDPEGVHHLRESVKKHQREWATGSGVGTMSTTSMLLACVITQLEAEQQANIQRLEAAVGILSGKIEDIMENDSAKASSAASPFRASPNTAMNTSASLSHGGKSHPEKDDDKLTRKSSSALPPATQVKRRASVVPTQTTAKTTGGKTPRPPVSRPQPKQTKRVIKPAATSTTGNSILKAARAIRSGTEELQTMGEKGSPSDKDIAEMDTLRKRLSRDKLQAAKDVLAADKSTLADAAAKADAKEELADFLEEITQEGDQHPGNADLVRALVKMVPMDWATVIASRQLAITAGYDGCLDFLNTFLQVPKLTLDPVEMVQSVMFNQTARIPATLAVLKNGESAVNLAEANEELADSWQEFFEDVCSNARAYPRENRAGRIELITRLVQHKIIKLDMNNEGSDAQTVFSRAAREGDVQLMTLLLSKPCPYVIDINRQQSDTMTPLIQAVVADKVDAVKLLLSLPHINAGIVSDQGSAATISVALKRNPEIQKLVASYS